MVRIDNSLKMSMENSIKVKVSLSCPEGEYTIKEIPINELVDMDNDHCFFPSFTFSISTIMDNIFPDDLPF